MPLPSLQSHAGDLDLCIRQGDIFALCSALAEVADNDPIAAAGLTEKARLEALVAQFGMPKMGSSALHVKLSGESWMIHSFKVDSTGRLLIRTHVMSLFDHVI